MTTASSILQAAHAIADAVERGCPLVVVCEPADGPVARHVAVEFTHPVTAGHRAISARAIATAERQPLPDHCFTIGIGVEACDVRFPSAVETSLADATTHHHIVWETAHALIDERETAADTVFLGSGVDDLDEALVDSIATKLTESRRQRAEVLAATSRAVDDAIDALKHAGTVFTAGNGGSSTDASWLAGALAPTDAWCLTDDVALLTALANDVGYDDAVHRAVAVHGRAGDVLVTFSTSGTSRNVARAQAVARSLGMVTIAFTGASLPDRVGEADILFPTRSTSIHRIQECHAAVVDVVVRGVTEAR